MPELPEVECVVRSLRPLLEGRQLLHVELGSARVASSAAAAELVRLAGSRVIALARRGKYVLIHTEVGRFSVHLRMTGRLVWNARPGPYTRAVFVFGHGSLLLDDVRQFARIEAGPGLAAAIAALGPEPFELTAGEFAARLRGRRGRIKPLLLDQRFLAGLGNIYADESLHRARIHPLAAAARLSAARARSLHAAILEVLEEAIAAGGSSISDYVDAEGRAGRFQLLHRVYGRQGEPCLRCGAPVRRLVVAQRGTHYCPRCQRLQ